MNQKMLQFFLLFSYTEHSGDLALWWWPIYERWPVCHYLFWHQQPYTWEKGDQMLYCKWFGQCYFEIFDL